MSAPYPVIQLGDLCDVLDSKRRPITKRDRVAGEYPYYGATGILGYVEGFIFDEPLVLIGEDGAKWGAGENTAFSAEGRYWVNNHAHVIRPHRQKVLDAWLIYQLNQADLSEFITGLTVPKLNQARMREIPIVVPPLDEQRRIVAVLDKAFTGIATATANAQKNLTNARALFESLLDQIFETDGSEWNIEPMSRICTIGDGNHSSKYPKNSEMVPVGVPFLRSTNIQDGNISLHDVLYISSEKHRELKKGHLKAGDVLFTNRGEIGKVAMIGEDLDGANLNSQIAWLRGKAEILPHYLYFYLQSGKMKKHYRQTQSGTALQQFTIKMLQSVKVRFPSLSKQVPLVKKLEDLRDETGRLEARYTQKLAALSQLKQSLLHKAFAGELT